MYRVRSFIVLHRCSPQTPLKHHVDIWCRWSFRDTEQIGSAIEIDFDVHCCQGLAFGFEESDNDTREKRHLLVVSRNSFSAATHKCYYKISDPWSESVLERC